MIKIRLFVIERHQGDNIRPDYWTCSSEHGSGWCDHPKQAFSPSELKNEMRELANNGHWHGCLVRPLSLGGPVVPIDVMDAATLASSSFGGTPGFFNTAGFQQELARRYGVDLDVISEIAAKAMLHRESRIVMLSGGCHWYILPNEMRRYTAE